MPEEIIKEAIEYLDKADQVFRFRLGLAQVPFSEHEALTNARDLVQEAITKLLPYQN